MSDAGSLLTARFSESAAYFDAINDVNVRFTLQGLETEAWEIKSLLLPNGINIQHCWSGSGSIAQGASREGGIELAIPAMGRYTANGQPVPVKSALLMVPGSEFLVSIPGLHSWFGVFVPDTLARSIHLNEDSHGRNRRGTCVVDVARPGTLSPPGILARFFRNMLAMPGLARNRLALTRFQDELLEVLGAAYGYAQPPDKRRPGRTPGVDHTAINRALDAIEASAEPNLAMSDLVRATSVPERSLRAGFRKYLGISPKQYMQLCTLNRARQRLASSRPCEVSVGEVVTELGVWDLGRFAARYRQMFGELPSSTLHRSNSTA